jgi:hypothetical protein
MGVHAEVAAGSSRVARLTELFGTRRRRLLGAFAFYLAATLIWLSPLVVHLGSRVLIGPSDATSGIRAYWAVAQQHGDPFTFTHDYLDGAPEGMPWNRAVEIATPVQTAVVFALHPLFGWIGSWNLFVMSGFVLTGFAGFFLLERLGFSPLVGLFGGYVLAFNPWSFERSFAGHAAFLQEWIFIAMILCFFELSRKRTLRWAALAGLCFGGAFLINSYFGLLGSLVFGLYLVFEFLRVRGWEEKLWTATLACTGLAVTGACLLPGLLAYLRDRATVAQTIANPVSETQRLGAATSDYLLPAQLHPVLGPIVRHFSSATISDDGSLFFGYTTMVLAAAGLVLVLRRDDVTLTTPVRRGALVFAAILLPLAYWASLKRIVHLAGVPIPTLSYFVGQATSYFRVYSRFGIIVAICLVMLAAPALELIVRRLKHGLIIGFALWLLVGFELIPGPIYTWAGTSNPPAYDRWLADQPTGIVAHYPLPTDQKPANDLGAREIYYQMFVGDPLFNLVGAGTFRTRESDIRIMARYITDPNTPSILAAEHVRYVVVHDDVYRQQGGKPPVVSSAFHLVKRFPNVRIYVVSPKVAPANLNELLQQNAVEIALVEGLDIPNTSYENFGSPDAGGLRSFSDGAGLDFDNNDPNLKQVQLIVNASSPGAPRVLQLVAPSGGVVGQAQIATANTQVTLGPFALAEGDSSYTLRVSGGPADERETMELKSLLVQPVADFSISLAQGK